MRWLQRRDSGLQTAAPVRLLRLTALRRWVSRLRSRVFGQSPKARSLSLLREHLTPTQRNEFDRLGQFHVIGCDTGRSYRLRFGVQINVDELNEAGCGVRTLCFFPMGALPVGDVMLAQKLALELFECEALRCANALPYRSYTTHIGWLR